MKREMIMANGSSRNRGRRGGAVSGPGALSERTDLNVTATDARQMLSEAPFGAEQALVNQVQQGNVAAEAANTSGMLPADNAPVAINPVEDFDLTAPTNYPDMPVTETGVPKQSYLEDDSMMLIRAMADIFPTDELLSLLFSQGSAFKQSPDDIIPT